MARLDHGFITEEGSLKGVVDSPDLCVRLDSFLSIIVGESLSRTKAAELVESGVISVNGFLVKKASRKLKMGDSFNIEMNLVEDFLGNLRVVEDLRSFSETGNKEVIEPQDLPLNIIAEDRNILILYKSAGMVVHPASGNFDGTLVNAVAGYFKSKNHEIPDRVGLVNRLDKAVSGIMVIAKNNRYLNLLGRQFEGLDINELEKIRKYEDLGVSCRAEKYYRATVEVDDFERIERFSSQDWILVKGFIFRDPTRRNFYKFDEDLNPLDLYNKYRGFKIRRCLSFIRLVNISKSDGVAEMEIRLVTGRTHQIRAQLSGLGLPIVGDINYGSKNELNQEVALRCVRLVLKYDSDGGVLMKDFLKRNSRVNLESGLSIDFKMNLFNTDGVQYLDIFEA